MHTLLLAACGQVRHTNALVLCSGSVPSDQSRVSFPSSILRLSWNHGVGCGVNAALEPEHTSRLRRSYMYATLFANIDNAKSYMRTVSSVRLQPRVLAQPFTQHR